jgi:ATP-dependent helicase/nuclease subunit B
MLHLILGGFGSGKTALAEREICAAVSAGRRSWLVVPEQATVATEHRMAELLQPSAPLVFEVSNFTRLADSLFRISGGLGVRYATSAARSLTMWRTLQELRRFLHDGIGECDSGEVARMLAAAKELSAARIGPSDLEAVSRKVGDPRLSERLSDLALILATYRSLLCERYADGETDLDAMSERLGTSDLFRGAHLIFDSFTSFTEQQYAVLAGLMHQADLTVTLTLPDDADTMLCYEETKDTYRRLASLARKNGIAVRETRLSGNRRTLSEPIRHLSENLFRADPSASGFEGERDRAVAAVTASDPYVASAFIASDILRRIREEGALYRDFAVLAANAEDYRGILDTALMRNGIPIFTSHRVDIASLEPIKLIISAYAVIIGGFRRSDLLTYLKCGFSGISGDAIDELELYTEKWSLSGRRMTESAPWQMNPDGFTDRMTAYGEAMLARVNATRDAAVKPLLRLADSSERQSVAGHCRVLCDFLLSLELPERLRERAARAGAEGDSERAEELSRLWDVICETLDTLAEVLPDYECSAEEFSRLFAMVSSEVDIGRIPASEDEVLFGSAEMLRPGSVRFVYLLGVNEGEFPASSRERGFFSDTEKQILTSLGLSLRADNGMNASRALFSFLRALSASTSAVTLLSMTSGADLRAKRPASVIQRIEQMLGDALTKIDADALPALDLIGTENAALERLGELRRDPIYPTVKNLLSEKYAERIRTAELPISSRDARISGENAARLYPERMSMTQSRLEKYIRCPFSHFCTYALGLRSGEPAAFDNNEIGSYIHAILETFFRGGQRPLYDYTDGEIETVAAELSEQYLRQVGQGEESTPRLARVFRSLRRSSALLIRHICDEMSESDFTPRFFELNIGGNAPGDPTACVFQTPDGGTLSLYGAVDRVDAAQVNGKIYLRVVDYKTGEKKLDLEDVRRGLNLQMLLYLFALWKNRNPAFREALGARNGEEILPAGVLYMGAFTGEIPLECPTSAEETHRLANDRIGQNGLLLDDREVLSAMEHGLAGRFIPVKLNKDGSYSKATEKSLASLERMGELLREIGETLSAVAGEMKEGKIPAYPRRFGKDNCQYCEMKPICRASL